MDAGWFFATANWKEHEDIRGLPVHPSDLSAGLVIPQYEPVAVRDGYIRPLYTDPNYTGVVLGLQWNPTGRKFAGFLLDSPYDEDGNLKTERKICIIRDGRAFLPAVISPPDWDVLVEGRNWHFVLNRDTIRGEKRVVAYLMGGENYSWNYFYERRSGMCRITKFRRFYVGGSQWWLHQASCSFHPSLVYAWEGY
jgi:hypothetical protein